MGYELSVSQVGPAEYPLIEVLRDSIFSELGHVFRSTLVEDLEGRTDIHALIAHLEGNPVGYKIGYRFGPGIYFSKSGGVLKDYRRLGLARQMHQWQHGWIRARGDKQVFYNTFPKFPGMICMGLQSGFVPVGVERRPEGEVSFKFVKDLTLPDPPQQADAEPGSISLRDVMPQDYGMVAAMASLSGDDLTEAQIEVEMKKPGVAATLAILDGKPVGFAYGRLLEDGVFMTTRFDVVGPARQRGAESAMASQQKQAAVQLQAKRLGWEAQHDAVGSIRSAVLAGYRLDGMRYDAATRLTYVTLSQAISHDAEV